MPAYIAYPQGPIPGLVPGRIGYSAGSFAANQADGKYNVTSSLVVANVVTLGVSIVEGNVPAVGDVVFVSAVQRRAGANGGPFTLTAVSIDSTGVGTITYAATTPDLGAGPDSGLVRNPVAEVAEALVQQAYQQFAVLQSPGFNRAAFSVNWSTTITGAPTAVIKLQAALVDKDSEYGDLDSSTGNETRTVKDVSFLYYRLNATSVTGGTAPKIIGRIKTGI